MSISRHFNAVEQTQAVYRAFETGEFSKEVINHLNEGKNSRELVANIPKHMAVVHVGPELLDLGTSNLCEMFKALPEHVEEVHFDFEHLSKGDSLNRDDFNRFIGLMVNSGYAKDAKMFHIHWDFELFPLTTLQDNLPSKALPSQLTHVTLQGPGATDQITIDDLKAFKAAKLGENTQVSATTVVPVNQPG